MKTNQNIRTITAIRWIVIGVVSLFLSCARQPSDQATHKKKYSFHLMTRDGSEYLIQTDSLESGQLNPLEGTPPNPQRRFYDLFPKNGYYYYLDTKDSKLIKAGIQGDTFEHLAAVQLRPFSSIENYQWVHADSLLVIGFDHETGLTRYARINCNDMGAVEGIVDIPRPSAPENWISIGFSKLEKETILLGYTYHRARNGHYMTSDTIRIDLLSYPSMKAISRSNETRSIYPGGLNTQQSYSFTDEKGDFYFVACPGIIAGNNPKKKTAIFRIPQGSYQTDPDYFFNISDSPIQNNGYGFWYIGNGKAIIRTERKEIFTGIGDHYKVPHFDFYVIDLEKQTTTRLDLPLDKGSSRQCILIENGRVYISVNSETEGCYIWILNPQTMTLKKGLEFTGEIEYILRMDPM